MSVNWSRATFRIASHKLSVTVIEDVLGVKASQSRAMGSPISPRTPELTNKESICLYEFAEGAAQDVERRIDAVVLFVRERKEQLDSIREDCSFELVLGCSSGDGQLGFVIGHDAMEQLAGLPIAVVVDVYMDESCDSD